MFEVNVKVRTFMYTSIFIILLIIPTAGLTQVSFDSLGSSPVTSDGGLTRGIVFVDYDNDTYADIYAANSQGSTEENFLYRNNGDGTFTKIINHSLVDFAQNSDCTAWGDYDNDGDLDLYIATWSSQYNRLYDNNGDGSFTRITGIEMVSSLTYSDYTSWTDVNNDGFLDLFVGYGFTDLQNKLYINDGDGTFSSVGSGEIVTDAFRTHGCAWGDYNNDGYQDLFVANSSGQHNNLYKNNGDGTFEKIITGPVVTDGGFSLRSVWGDYDNDGYLDLHVSNGNNELNFLYHNNGDGTFAKVVSGPVVSEFITSQSCAFADFDNDGDLDLFVANGFGPASSTNSLFWNDGSGNFTKETSDIIATEPGWALGCSFADFDLDGDLDIVVGKGLGGVENNALYVNQGNSNNWLSVTCRGTESNFDGIGCRVRAVATIASSTVSQIREISSPASFGNSGLSAWFGLGDAVVVDSLIVTWPSGVEQARTNVSPNQRLEIIEPGVRMLADTTFGSETLTTQFSSVTGLTVTEWNWDFGDGDNAMAANPQHTYAAPGVYEVALDITADEGNYSAQHNLAIAVEADSIAFVDKAVQSAGVVTVDISVTNYVPLTYIEIPVQWSGSLVHTLQSVNNSGQRSSFMTGTTPSVDPFNKRLTYRLEAPPDSALQPGSGPVARLTFDISSGSSGDSTLFQFIDYDEYSLEMITSYGTYIPDSVSGVLSILCCLNERGNVDGDMNDEVNIADLLYLVDYSFANPSGPSPVCTEEADVDGSGMIDIADILYLVDYMFAVPAGPAPVDCTI